MIYICIKIILYIQYKIYMDIREYYKLLRENMEYYKLLQE